MKLCIISGSHRINSQTEKISRYVLNFYKKQFPEISCELILLAGNPYPLFDESFFDKNNEKWKQAWQPTAQKLAACDAAVVLSPEWAGMVPPGLKNFLLLASGEALAHKPGLIVTVSSSMGGAYPLNELRTSGYKNSRICYIPDHVIVRDCEHVLNKETAESERDQQIRNRLEYSARVLLEYAKAFQGIRSSGVINFKDYPFGM